MPSDLLTRQASCERTESAPDVPSDDGPAGANGEEPGFPPVAVIGGNGKMGAMLCRRLCDAGYSVWPVDCRASATGETQWPADLEPVLGGVRIVLVCVPVTALPAVLAGLAPKLRADHLLMDVTSVKTLPMRWMDEAFAGAVVGSHPLFGPNPAPEDMRVALVRGRRADERDAIDAAALFGRLGCDCFWTTAEEHDAGVAFAQSLNFTVSAAFFAALARRPGIRPFLTPSFKRHLEAARKHLTQDTAMFLEFTSMNPEYAGALGSYKGIIDEALSGKLADVARQAAGWYAEE